MTGEHTDDDHTERHADIQDRIDALREDIDRDLHDVKATVYYRKGPYDIGSGYRETVWRVKIPYGWIEIKKTSGGGVHISQTSDSPMPTGGFTEADTVPGYIRGLVAGYKYRRAEERVWGGADDS